MSRLSDRAWLMREAAKITAALGETFAPLCEVVLHDLTNPEHAIIQIENNLSGRAVGDSATEMGLARMADPKFPDVVANYANTFTDGRQVKSTSIGLRDKSGNFVAAICINVDVAYLQSFGAYLSELTRINARAPVTEALASQNRQDIRDKVMSFSAARNRDPRALTSDEKREILRQLALEGEFERRGAAEQVAALIGVSRSNVYYYLKSMGTDDKKDRKAAARRPRSRT